jgi:hypothetical protein
MLLRLVLYGCSLTASLAVTALCQLPLSWQRRKIAWGLSVGGNSQPCAGWMRVMAFYINGPAKS